MPIITLTRPSVRLNRNGQFVSNPNQYSLTDFIVKQFPSSWVAYSEAYPNQALWETITLGDMQHDLASGRVKLPL